MSKCSSGSHRERILLARLLAGMQRLVRKCLKRLEARVGFEPTNGGFADLSLGPLGYRAELASIANLRNIAGAPTRRFAEVLPFLIGWGRSLDPGAVLMPNMPATCGSRTFCYDAVLKEPPMPGSAHLLSFILSVLLASDRAI